MNDAPLLEFQTALAGRYALERELGRGGMGIVFRARDLRLERVVAIKLLPRALAQMPAARDRFVREARIAARLSHPHIIPIHAVEEAGEFVFFVMSYVDGETLGARVRREGPLKPHDAARVLREVAWALAYAHGQGVIHRDVKPENILLEQGSAQAGEGGHGRALVADFGIARLFTPGGTGEQELVGTPEYMSPEQALRGSIDGRSDLYSLGIVGYYMLSGRLPFTAATTLAVIGQQVQKTPPPLEAPGAPKSLLAAVERCLAKDPARRFQTGEELASELGETLERRRELPVPLRAFLSTSRSGLRAQFTGPLLVAAVLVPAGLGVLIDTVFAGHPPALFRGAVIGIAILLLAGAVTTPLVLAARSVRRLLKSGYRHEDLIQGLELEVARRREEEDFTADGTKSWERLMRGKMYGALALAAVAGVAGFLVSYPAVLVVFGLFGLASATAVATGLAAWAASRGQLGGAERRQLKFWKSAIGRWLFRIAGIGRSRGDALPPTPDRPTEIALGVAAIELFEQLPEAARRQLGELPHVVRALQQRVQRLRQNGLTPELQEALGALETIRLDLLRLNGGVGTLDGITQDLGAAREIGEQVDAMLAGKETPP